MTAREGRGRRTRRVAVLGIAIVSAAAAVVGIGAVAGAVDPVDQQAVAAASTVPRPSVTAVAASSTGSSTRTAVRTSVTVRNTGGSRTSALPAWLYLASSSGRYALGHVPVRALPAGRAATVRATLTTASRVPAGKYAVVACTGVYSASTCRTSTSTVRTGHTTPARPETGVMLDVARAYYRPSLVERYIDLLAAHGGRFLHLHLTDDQNVGIESAVLGQTPANADLHDGVYTSRVTGRPFLSTAQARGIAAYAAKRGIAIVPEVDTPGHMAAAFALLEARHGKRWVDRIRSGESELDPSAPGSVALATELLAEVMRTFPQSRAVHIGGDEWGEDVSADERVTWSNTMAAAIGTKSVWAWNDGIDRSAVRRLDPRIRVTYWSLDGDTEDATERRERRQHRARASDLATAGTDLLNYDSYYLYEVPTDLDPADSSYTAADLRQHWTLRTWDGDSGARLATPMSGSAVAVWGEDLDAPPSRALLRWSTPHIVAMIETADG
ncbi:family 20 glycosylhydrolase [Curtobacterium luteum]|uniref:family 20 glycosylhydrolase n=1 Tax=Curtobacterium luteum TaxID=33881 RepID=UPI0009F8C35F|nr:family 20 glycosylhydrolase [Curtobacterium luteum]